MRAPPLLPLLLLGLHSCSSTPTPTWPGPRADGSTLLPNGWRLDPHGSALELASDFPVRLAWHPAGHVLAIQHAGYRQHEIALYDEREGRVVQRIPLGKSWSGMAWSPDGKRLYVSGGVDDRIVVIDYDVGTGLATLAESWPVGDPTRLDLPAGIAVDGEGRLFVPLQRGQALVRLSTRGQEELRIELPPESFPYECVLTSPFRGEARVYVSLWGRAEVRGYAAESGAERALVATGEHPSELALTADERRLFVSAANENSVHAIDLAQARVDEVIGSALYPSAPPGSTPNALALSPDGRVLLVANADNNDCAVIDVSEPGHARGLGFVPLGWYPTAIRFSPDGARVLVANGKGHGGSRPNPGGPSARPDEPPLDLTQYVGSMFSGSLTRFEYPTPEELGALSERAYACSPLRPDAGVRADARRPAKSPIPAAPGEPSPIRHCIYILKENRTFDQVLGDDPRGNGDPALCLFPEQVTPNHHALASEFVLLDNFYVESEVSADGHEWSMGAYATDFVERTWPVTYGGKGAVEVENGRPLSLGYPSEGGWDLARPKNGYIWDMAARAGLSYCSYGEFVENAARPDQPGRARIPVLEGHFDPYYRSYDLGYPDVRRATRFLEELARYEEEGEMPALIVLRLPNDHTAGTAPDQLSPRALVADNDLALGLVLEGLSLSSFWETTTVFVVEDDAQNGPDHVDAHRTIAFVAGPWVKRGAVVSELYSTSSMLRTIELILGLEPMSQFDAAARPMYACFAERPDASPYRHRPPTWPLDERNAPTAWGSELSSGFDLAREDAADDLLLNEVIWRSIRGADNPMPRPKRAAFVRVHEEAEEEEGEAD